jgi:NAD(P)-dependent dehydrogenase (short-subunit alcohol dehydrogenase family)
VSSAEQLTAAAQKVKDTIGYVNVVVANTGISGPQVSELPNSATVEELQSFLWKQGMQAYTDTYHMNVSTVLFTLIAFLLLLDSGNKDPKSPGASTGIKSQFIVTSSIAGFNRKPTAGFAYGSTKAAVNHLMKQMSSYLVPYHIRVNVICPGLYPSELSGVSARHATSSPARA